MKRLLTALVIGCAIALSLFSWPAPTPARSCYHRQDHEICLEQVQRSAKYHWQYRVQATVDGQPQPLTQYNCRDRTRTAQQGSQKGLTVKFAPQGVGDLICQLVNR